MDRIKQWFHANTEHITDVFIGDQHAEPLHPDGGYLRIWLAEGILATARSWGADRYPALHGIVTFPFHDRGPTQFSTLIRSPLAPGAQNDFPITPLLPFRGGVIEIDAALYQVTTESPLVTALQLIGALEPLLGPPLDLAAAIAEKLGQGIQSILDAHDEQPLLALHKSLVSPGGNGTVLRSGHAAVLTAPPARLQGTPSISGGHLVLASPAGAQAPTGTDYLVLRVECRTERDDWNLPYLDTLVTAASEAYLTGQQGRFASLRTEAIVRAYSSPDLVSADRKRVAKLVAERIDEVKELGAAPTETRTLAQLAPRRLAAADDPELDRLTLRGLLR